MEIISGKPFINFIYDFQRCVVVQEVYPDGLIASDGRLQPGDQIIEINGIDMTCAPHAQVRNLRCLKILLLNVYFNVNCCQYCFLNVCFTTYTNFDKILERYIYI